MFDESLVGYTAPPFTVPVERGKVVELARALGLQDRIHLDVDVARDEGRDDVVAPPTFSTVMSFWRPELDDDPIRYDVRRAVAGGAEWEYLGEIVAGDVLTVTMQVTSVEHKVGRRGPMTLLTREFSFVNQRDDLVLRLSTTSIELGDGGN